MRNHLLQVVIRRVAEFISRLNDKRPNSVYPHVAMFVSVAIGETKNAYPSIATTEGYWADICSDAYETVIECVGEGMWDN